MLHGPLTARGLYGAEGSRDTIRGNRGQDVICGGPGDDRLIGLTGRDRLYGGRGNDVGFGDTGRDRLYGGTGRDTLAGGSGNDARSTDGSRTRCRRISAKPLLNGPDDIPGNGLGVYFFILNFAQGDRLQYVVRIHNGGTSIDTIRAPAGIVCTA